MKIKEVLEAVLKMEMRHAIPFVDQELIVEDQFGDHLEVQGVRPAWKHVSDDMVVVLEAEAHDENACGAWDDLQGTFKADKCKPEPILVINVEKL